MPRYGDNVGVRNRHHDQELGGAKVRREELVPVDYPLFAVAFGPALELLRIGAALRLGHRVGRETLPLEQGLEVALLLLGRCHRRR